VGRTFQQIRLFAEMTVSENITVGAVSRGLRLDDHE
jgi:ABC-type branched-subunit amino acid transport system ATPase component